MCRTVALPVAGRALVSRRWWIRGLRRSERGWRLALLLCFSVLIGGCATHRTPQRYAWVTGLKPEKAEYYRDLHAQPWPAVNQTLKDCHIQNFSIHECTIEGNLYLFAYLEYTGVDFEADMERMAADPETQRWWKETDPCQSPLPAAAAAGKIWADTRELYFLK